MSSAVSLNSSFPSTVSPSFREPRQMRFHVNDHSQSLPASQAKQHPPQYNFSPSALTELSICEEDSSDSEDDESVYYTAEEDFYCSDEESCDWDEEEDANAYEEYTRFCKTSNNTDAGRPHPSQLEDPELTLPPLWSPEERERSLRQREAHKFTLPPLWDQLSFLTGPSLDQRSHLERKTPPQHPKMALSYIINSFHVEPSSLLPIPFSDQWESHPVCFSQPEASERRSSPATSIPPSSSFSSPVWSFVPDCSSDLNVYAHGLTPAVYLAHPSREPGNTLQRPPLPGPLIVL